MLNNQMTIEMALEQLKVEIANEMGIVIGAETSAKDNGSVGGQITRKLIQLGEQKLVEMYQDQSYVPVNTENSETTNQLH